MKMFDRTYVEIDLNAITHNYRMIRQAFGKVRVMSVLKGDAYGHGISRILEVCDPNTDYYAVATVEEGIAIRRWGSKKPVLIFGPVPNGKMAEAVSEKLTFTVSSLAYARNLVSQLQPLSLTADCHIKIDTGLNRTGIRWREDTKQSSMEDIAAIHNFNCLRVTGTYTHFACPESLDEDDQTFTEMQFARFQEVCEELLSRGLPTGLRHCCATGGALAHPEYRLDMVRTGMMLYGQCDTLEHMHQYGLRQALCWKSTVTQVEQLKAGESVSYGRTYRAPKDMVLGVVSCGYADGYRRSYQAFGKVLVGGKRVATLGRVCMDYLLVDLTEIETPEVGMEVVLLGTQGNESITAIEISEAVDSVCGEVTGAISGRVARYYR